jgi:hypothetical protein
MLTKLDSNLILGIDFARVLAPHALRLSPPHLFIYPTDAPKNPTPSRHLRPSSSPTPRSTAASRAWPPVQEASLGCRGPVLTFNATRDPQRATLTVSHRAKKGDTTASPSCRLHETHNDQGEFPSSSASSRASRHQNQCARASSSPGFDEQQPRHHRNLRCTAAALLQSSVTVRPKLILPEGL